jgi:hypothetical protein
MHWQKPLGSRQPGAAAAHQGPRTGGSCSASPAIPLPRPPPSPAPPSSPAPPPSPPAPQVWNVADVLNVLQALVDRSGIVKELEGKWRALGQFRAAPAGRPACKLMAGARACGSEGPSWASRAGACSDWQRRCCR